MGTTAQKLEYLGTTKSQLKDMINYGLDGNNKITSSTTFREYVSSIFNAFLEALRTPDTLFTNLPKKSGTGAYITLNDTANAPMRITLGATELSQAGTPTPESPQTIHTISGDNSVKASNKNLANLPSNTQLPLSSSTTIIDFGKDVTFSAITTSFILNNAIFTNSSGAIINYQKDDGTNNYRIGSTHFGMSANTTLTGTYSRTETNITFRKVILGNWASFTQGTMSIQLEKGSTATSYEPYKSQVVNIPLGDLEVCKIPNTTYEDEFYKATSSDTRLTVGKWYLKKNIGKYVFTGNETVEIYASSNYAFMLYVNNLQKLYIGDATTTMCNQLQATYTNDIYSKRNNANYNLISSHANSGSASTFLIMMKNYTTVQEVKDYLAQQYSNNTPVMAYFVLATPTYTPLNDTLQNALNTLKDKLLAYKDQTNISQVNNDLPFTISASALKDLSSL